MRISEIYRMLNENNKNWATFNTAISFNSVIDCESFTMHDVIAAFS